MSAPRLVKVRRRRGWWHATCPGGHGICIGWASWRLEWFDVVEDVHRHLLAFGPFPRPLPDSTESEPPC